MMGFTWFIVGLLTTGSVVLVYHLSKAYRLNTVAWLGMGSGLILVLFTIAWGVGSVLEGVPRAASMGAICFGLPGILLSTGTFRYIHTKLEKRSISSFEPKAVTSTPERRHIAKYPVKQKPKVIPKQLGRVLYYGALVSLAIAFILGIVLDNTDYESLILAKKNDLSLTKIHDAPVVFRVGEEAGEKNEYILIQEGQGYGGPFVFGIRIGENAKVIEMIPLSDKETPAFITKIQETDYKSQFINKPVSDNFLVGDDIDAVTGATVTTMAATEAVRKAAHEAAVTYFKMEQAWETSCWKFGVQELLVAALFLMAFSRKILKAPYKYAYIAATLGIVGFYLNGSISVGSLTGLFMGYVPAIADHMIWWILVVGTVAVILVSGDNIYCYRICPFYWIQFLLNKLSGNRYSLPAIIGHNSRFIANSILWLTLMIIFLSRHPAAGSFEPFAMMFSLEGEGVQWYILPLAVVGAFFINNFWCRLFCPTGSCLSNVLRLRNKVVRKVKTLKDRRQSDHAESR